MTPMRAFALAALLNFLAFVAIANTLGGDAVNGYASGGHYFLGLHSNGPYREVSGAVFRYSQWHLFSVAASILIVLIAAARQGMRRR